MHKLMVSGIVALVSDLSNAQAMTATTSGAGRPWKLRLQSSYAPT